MKKVILYLFMLFMLTGCDLLSFLGNPKLENEVSIIVPNGIPYLAVAGIKENENVKMDTTTGGENLKAALLGGEYDLVVAPINVGAQLFAAGKSKYQMVTPITFNNAYIVCREELPLESIDDLIGKSVTAFNQTGIPAQVLTKIYNDNSALDIANVDFTLKSSAQVYQSFVGEGNDDNYVLMSEPEISKVIINNKIAIKTLDLCSVLGESIPQAALFVNPDANLEDVNIVIDMIEDNIKEMNTNTASCIDKVLTVDEEFFSAIGKEVLLSSVPRANVKFDLENRKTESANVFALLGVKGVTDAFYYEKD